MCEPKQFQETKHMPDLKAVCGYRKGTVKQSSNAITGTWTDIKLQPSRLKYYHDQ